MTMRNLMKLSGPAILVILAMAGVASAQTVIQPNYEPGGGSGQSFVYQPGATSGTSLASRSPGSSNQGPVTGYGAGGMAHAPGTPPNGYFHGGVGGHGR
jgi:hypothetical protein